MLVAAYQGQLGRIQSAVAAVGIGLLREQSSTGETILHAAAKGRQLAVVQWLLQQTPLMLEARTHSGATVGPRTTKHTHERALNATSQSPRATTTTTPKA